jgi:ribosomal protein L9
MKNYFKFIVPALILGSAVVGIKSGANTPVAAAESTSMQASNIDNPEVSRADSRVRQTKAQLEMAKKQMSAAKALLKAAEADFKAARTELEAVTLKSHAQRLADASGFSSVPATAEPIKEAASKTQVPLPGAQVETKPQDSSRGRKNTRIQFEGEASDLNPYANRSH